LDSGAGEPAGVLFHVGQCRKFTRDEARRIAANIAKLLTRDEARRIAVNIAKFPEFLKKA